MFKRRVLVPADNGTPADLPPWARDELVRRRVEMGDLERENLRLRAELEKARAAAFRESAFREIHRPYGQNRG